MFFTLYLSFLIMSYFYFKENDFIAFRLFIYMFLVFIKNENFFIYFMI
jgi:hypothetical protein